LSCVSVIPELSKSRMLILASVLLLGFSSALADSNGASMGCCKYKRMPGPMAEDYFLVEHRLGLPKDCKDGCVYTKLNSEKKEYCFKRSSRYPSAECKDTGCNLETNFAADGQSYNVSLKTEDTGILTFEFDRDIVRANVTVVLHSESNITPFCRCGERADGSCKPCNPNEENFAKTSDDMGSGDYIAEVSNSGSVPWETLPMIKAFYVNELPYC